MNRRHLFSLLGGAALFRTLEAVSPVWGMGAKPAVAETFTPKNYTGGGEPRGGTRMITYRAYTIPNEFTGWPDLSGGQPPSWLA